MDEQARVIPYIKVTNGNTKPIKDKYDGVPFVFPAGGTVQLEYHVAQHFFGLPDPDFETGMIPALDTEQVKEAIYHHMIQRYGYNSMKSVEAGDDRKFVGNFRFKPLIARLVVEETEGPETSAGEEPPVEEPTPEAIPVRSGRAARTANAARVPDQSPHAGPAVALRREPESEHE